MYIRFGSRKVDFTRLNVIVILKRYYLYFHFFLINIDYKLNYLFALRNQSLQRKAYFIQVEIDFQVMLWTAASFINW